MLNILVQLLSYLTAAGIPFLMLAGGMKPHFYYPLYALPILSLSYFSGPLSTAGMFVISLLVGIGGFIFSVGDIQYGIPFLFLLQMGWLWLLFWL
ncbi:MAG: hypothetical protein HYY63_01640, partial [Elusimicrobia bacterium]|nr:hypothetical protein [Elusimicrobiota bacterium]